jgi:hypothetical protein
MSIFIKHLMTAAKVTSLSYRIALSTVLLWHLVKRKKKP